MLPTRISACKGDPGYDAVLCRHAQVTLDGHKLLDCVTADETTGTALVLCKDAAGRPIYDPVTHQFTRTEVQGDVRIDWSQAKANRLAMAVLTDRRSWRIDHSQELTDFYRLAETLGLSTGTCP